MRYEFLAIGDITGDAFIRLKDARVNCDINDENCQLCVRFGDKIPYESVTVVNAVGNSSNAAVSAARLGVSSGLITHLGNDENGAHYKAVLKDEHVGTEYVTAHDNIPSNFHYVLQYEAERTILIKHHEYPYALPDIAEDPAWIYLSSMGENSLPFHGELAAYLSEHPNVQLAFQPGTFHIALGTEKLKDMYAHSAFFICNKQEAQKILNSTDDDIRMLVRRIHELGPKKVVITDGPRGAHASDGTTLWSIPMYPDPAPPIDRTGAGDATASTTVAFLHLGLPLPEALMRGVVNAMNVVQYVGAREGLLSREKIEALIADAPADFKPTVVA